MIQPGRSYTAGSGYRYGFNGKEQDNEISGQGNQYDYGFRIYDPRLGRFLSVDLMARSYSGESNYIFSGNSPIQFTDYNGLFKISPYFVAKYPTLARLLQDYLPLLKDNPQIKSAWIRTVGFSNYSEGEAAFDEMVTYGSGPYITATMDAKDIKNPSWHSRFTEPTDAGSFGPDYLNNLVVTKYDLATLETALKTGNADEIGIQMFVVSVIIMHESAHWGKLKFNCCEKGGDRYEMGATFEYEAFGQRFSYKNKSKGYDRDAAKAYYGKELGGYGSPTFGMSINNKNERYNYWNSIKNKQLKPGQKGDPFLIDNETNENVPVPRRPYVPEEKSKSTQFAYN